MRIAAALACGAVTIRGDETREFLMRSAPYPVFTSVDPSDYNLKWGRIIGRLHGSSAFELNDNINLADRGAEGDLSIGPTVGIGFLWPLSSANVMNFDLDFGYRAARQK